MNQYNSKEKNTMWETLIEKKMDLLFRTKEKTYQEISNATILRDLGTHILIQHKNNKVGLLKERIINFKLYNDEK